MSTRPDTIPGGPPHADGRRPERSSPVSRPHASGRGDGTATARRPVVLALASIASFMVALDVLVVTTALDTIRRDLGTSTSALQWTVTAFSVSFAGLMMTGAALGDRFGRRRTFAFGLGVFVVGSAAAALSGNVGTLVAARVVQGVGAALILPLGLAIVSAAFPPERRGAAIGMLEGLTGLAVIAGPLLGGVITERLSWEWVFWINVPVGVAAIPLVLLFVEESHGPDKALDGRGVALVTAAAVGLVWGLVRGNAVGWLSPEIVVTLAAGTALAVAFVAWERRVPEPMLPMRFFRSRAFSAGAATAFLLAASLYSTVFFMAQYLQAGLGHDPWAAGGRLVPWTATLLLVAPLAGRLGDRHGPRPVMAGGLALQAVGLAWLALIATTDLSYGTMVVPLIVAGAGISAALPVSQAAIVGAVEEAAVGKAAGANNMLQELGGAFGVAVAVTAFGTAGGYASAQVFTDGFQVALGAAAGLAALGVAAALAMPGRVGLGEGAPDRSGVRGDGQDPPGAPMSSRPLADLTSR